MGKARRVGRKGAMKGLSQETTLAMRFEEGGLAWKFEFARAFYSSRGVEGGGGFKLGLKQLPGEGSGEA